MPNIFTGDLNGPIIDWQMETADGRTHENQVQANAFLKFSKQQCLIIIRAIYRGANEKK